MSVPTPASSGLHTGGLPVLGTNAGVPSAPRFGCRLFAKMNGEPERDTTLQSELDAFYKQCRPEPDCDTGNPDACHAQGDGAGTSAYFDDKPHQLTKTGLAARDDQHYRDTVKGLVADKPKAIISHLRYGTKARDDNAHPFARGDWSFMHNGTLPPFALQAMQRSLAGKPDVKGDTDSEKAFHTLMNDMQDAHGTLKADEISDTELKQDFKALFRDIWQTEKAGEDSGEKPPDRFSRTPDTLATDSTYGLNFIITDGERLVASRYKRPLYLGVVPDKQGKAHEALLATRPLDTRHDIDWKPLNDQSMLFMKRRKDGTIAIEKNMPLPGPQQKKPAT